jgi:hypothetical protein
MPAKKTVKKNKSRLPSAIFAETENPINPAAGPVILTLDLLIIPTTTPPIIPDNNPDEAGKPEDKAMPIHIGIETREIRNPERISLVNISAKFLFMNNFF